MEFDYLTMLNRGKYIYYMFFSTIKIQQMIQNATCCRLTIFPKVLHKYHNLGSLAMWEHGHVSMPTFTVVELQSRFSPVQTIQVQHIYRLTPSEPIFMRVFKFTAHQKCMVHHRQNHNLHFSSSSSIIITIIFVALFFIITSLSFLILHHHNFLYKMPCWGLHSSLKKQKHT